MGVPVLQPRCSCVDYKTLVIIVRLVIGRSRYQLFKVPIIFTFMRSFSTTELFLHWLTSTSSFLDTPFLQQRCFGVDITHFFSDRLTREQRSVKKVRSLETRIKIHDIIL